MAIGIGQAAGKIRKFFFADEMVRDAGREVKGVYYHNLDKVPIKQIDANDPPTKWIYEQTLDGGIVVGSNQRIRCGDVERARDRILQMRRNRPILIISGTHGEADGGNWAINSSNNIVRHEKVLDPKFLREDIREYRHNHGNIFVCDIKDFDDVRLGRYLNGPSYDIILACCYSRNDSALRHFLNLDPVTSFVVGSRYAELQQETYRPILFP